MKFYLWQSDKKNVMAMVAILKMSNPKCTFKHPKNHSCKVSLQSDPIKIFLEEKKFPIGFYSKLPNYLGPSKYYQSSPIAKFQTFLHNWIHRSIIIPNLKQDHWTFGFWELLQTTSDVTERITIVVKRRNSAKTTSL